MIRFVATGWLALLAAGHGIGCAPGATVPSERIDTEAGPTGTEAGAAVEGGAEADAPSTLGQPRSDLSADELAAFERGRVLFQQPFGVGAGLGPYYNDTACSGCHHVPVIGGQGDSDDDAYLGPTPSHLDVFLYEKHAIPGVAPKTIPQGATHRSPPPLFGIGLFDRASDAAIAAGCGAGGADDGVTGHVDVDDAPGAPVDRFGQKAFVKSLRRFVSEALMGEMGIATFDGEMELTDDDPVPDPELPEAQVEDLASYLRGLSPPPRLGEDPAGEALFAAVGCGYCHRRDTTPEVPSAYTDLCEHHMGPALDDAIGGHQAATDEFRTMPLWGLRFRKALLHDGRASSVDAAIRIHAGEAQTAVSRYVTLTDAERAQLLAFLQTL